MRYDPNGALDNSFGTGGKVVSGIGIDTDVNDAVLQTDGKLVVVGYTDANQIQVRRFNGDGTLDTTFDFSGHVETTFKTFNFANSVIIQPDGKIVLAGDSNNFERPNGTPISIFALARYFNNDTSPTPTGSNVTVQTSNAAATFTTVSQAGTTTFTPINPASAGTLPSGYTVCPTCPAYDITTTATYTPPITVCLAVPASVDQPTFSTLSLLHGESGVLVDRTTSRVTNPDGPRKVCGSVSSLSPFVLAQPPAPMPTTVQLSATSYSVGEGDGFATLTVNRTGDLSAPATVKYATSDATDVNFRCDPNTPGQVKGAASRKCDYHLAVGRLRFAAGESAKQIQVSIVDDVYVEGPETFTFTLSNPTGATLGANTTATITITDNDTTSGAANPIDGTRFYVRQLYVDLLSREPDPAGFAGWIHRIDFCGQPGEAPPPCDRVTVGGDGFLALSSDLSPFPQTVIE